MVSLGLGEARRAAEQATVHMYYEFIETASYRGRQAHVRLEHQR